MIFLLDCCSLWVPTLAYDEKYCQVVSSQFFGYFGVSKEYSGQCPLTATLSQFVVTGKLCRACSPTQISHFSPRSSSNKASHCRVSQRCERGHQEQMRKLSSHCGGKASDGLGRSEGNLCPSSQCAKPGSCGRREADCTAVCMEIVFRIFDGAS